MTMDDDMFVLVVWHCLSIRYPDMPLAPCL